ncbi:sigma-70 family RNA polymerase sigma factor [Oerskovia sp. USHLN155]|uniref:sigma-70 family RNA polymerase sigma factor n=1 Tax=Oerskovia sp. USHLN155 TaxID=3081288 RepID=UPI003018330C
MTQVDTSRDDAPTSDAELITAVRGGDYAAFGALYERHAAAARTVARQYVRSGSDADDMVSEAFAKVLGILQSGGGPDVTFRAYLFTVVRRLSYDLSNAGRRTQPTDDIETFESAFGPMASTEDPTLQGFERSVVTKAYQGLPERWQAVLWYTEVEEMNPAQIAPLLGLTANGVSALAYRAREGLRQAYLQQHLTGASSAGCENVNPLLGSYVRGGLAKRETAKVDAHLEECGECRALVLELGDVSHGMRAVIAPLVFGVAALGLVGTALPLTGGAAVGAGAAGATGAASGASGSAGSGAAGASGSGAAGSGAAAGGSGAAAGTGAAGGAAGTGAMGGAAAAGAAATSGGLGAAAAVGASAAAGTGAAAAAGATGLAAFIAASPLIAAAVGVVAVAAVGAGVVAVSGGFSSEPPPSAGASPDPSASTSPSGAPTSAPTGEPSAPPSGDPTSPANTVPLAEAPADTNPAAPASNGDAAAGSGTAPAGQGEPTTPLVPPTFPLTPVAPVVPGPDPVVPVDPPTPASLDLAFAPLTLAPRDPEDLTLTASNSGGTSAEEVVVDVTLPPNVSVVTSAVTAGRGVVPTIRLAALPCGPASLQADGSSLVTCSVGVLSPGETTDLVITVQASRGGTYTFGGTVHGKGLTPVKKEYVPAPVPSYGAEIDLVTPTVGPLVNPGATSVRLTARNTGDVDAQGVAFFVGDLPAGVTAKPLDSGWTCSPGDASLRCTPTGGAALVAPDGSQTYGPPVSLDVLLLAGDGAEATTAGLSFSATTTSAGRTLKDSASAELTVGEPWAGADKVAAGATFAAQCVDGAATVVLKGVANTTSYDDLRVTLGVDDANSRTASLPRGATTQLEVPHDLRVPKDASASLTLVTTVDAREFTRKVPVAGVPAKDCFVPQWLSGADVTTHTSNEAGSVRLEAVVTNSTGRPLAIQVDDMTPVGAEEASRGTAMIDPGESATFFRSTGEQALASGDVVVRQHLSVPDADGDPGEYDQHLTVGHAGARIAPQAAAPTVGQCVFDLGSRTSVADVVFSFDNSASTLPVEFDVAGQDGLRTVVAAGEKATVTAPGLLRGLGAHEFTVLVDGRVAESFTLHGESCYVPQWSQEVSVAAENVGGQVRLTGTVVNTTAEAMDVRMLAPAGLGTKDSEKVTLAAGQTGSFTIDTGRQSLDAGKVTFRQYRWVTETGATGKGYQGEVVATFDRAVIAPKATVAAGQCAYDPAAHASATSVSLTFDNSSSTLPVQFTVAGRDDLAQVVAPGKVVPVMASAGYQGATFTVSADGRQVASQSIPAASCYVPSWSATQSARAEAADKSVRIVGTYTNTSPGTVRVRMYSPTYGFAGAAVDVPAGATQEFFLPTGVTRLPAGTVQFQQSVTADGVARSNTVTAKYEAARYDVFAPTVGPPILGVCYFEDNEQQSYRPVTFVYDNIASTAAVTFHVEVNGVVAPETHRVVQDQKRVQLKVPNVPERGATYRVVADSGHSWTFEVAGQTCLPTWHWTEAYRVGDRVAYEGRNYIATAWSVSVVPDSAFGAYFWRDESRG